MPDAAAGSVDTTSSGASGLRPEIVIAQSVTVNLRDRLWEIYCSAFANIEGASISVQRVDQAQFAALVDSTTTFKVLGLRDGEPMGLILLTDDLDLIPGISVAAFARRFPDAWSRRALFYVAFAFVSSSCRIPNLFPTLIAAASQIPAARNGVAVVDMCRELEQAGQVKAIERALRGFNGAAVDEIDAQLFYALTLPKPTRRWVGQIALTDVVVDLPDGQVHGSRANEDELSDSMVGEAPTQPRPA